MTPAERQELLERWLEDAKAREWPEGAYRAAIQRWLGCQLEEVPDDKLRLVSVCTASSAPDFPLEGYVAEAMSEREAANGC